MERPDDFGTAFAEVQRNRAQALIVSSSGLFYVHRTRLVEFAGKHRLPTIYHQSEFVVVSGGLMSYGPDFRDLFRRAATYVDKILRDAAVAAGAGGSGDRVTSPRCALGGGRHSGRHVWRDPDHTSEE